MLDFNISNMILITLLNLYWYIFTIIFDSDVSNMYHSVASAIISIQWQQSNTITFYDLSRSQSIHF